MIIELNGWNQKTLEFMAIRKLKEIEENYNKSLESYNKFDELCKTDERYRRYTKDEFKKRFVDSWIEKKKLQEEKLALIREGYIYE